MKSKILLIAFAALITSGTRSLYGDVFSPDDVTVTGSITTETNSSGTTTIKPLTFDEVFSKLHIQFLGGSPKSDTLRYYFDPTVNGIVIGEKNANLSSATPIATVLTFETNGLISWSPTTHSLTTATTVEGLNTILNGIGVQHETTASKTETYKTKFTVYGPLAAQKTIMTGNVVEVHKL